MNKHGRPLNLQFERVRAPSKLLGARDVTVLSILALDRATAKVRNGPMVPLY
jgi:hypothetical protein